MELKLKYILLYVDNLDASKQFYGEWLGFPIKGEYGTYIEFETGQTILSMNTRGGGREVTNLPIPEGRRNEQTFEIGFITEDVKSVVARLKEKGIKVLMEPTEKPWGQTVAYVEDPDGHYIEICTPMN